MTFVVGRGYCRKEILWMSRLALIATLICFSSSTVLAQNASSGMTGGMHPMNSPCAADRQKYCKNVKPGGGRLIDCFVAHKEQLAPACRDRMKAAMAVRSQQGAAGAQTPNAKPQNGKPPG